MVSCRLSSIHIDNREPLVGAWTYLNKDLIISSAKKADERRQKGIVKSMSGLPIGIKDIIDTFDMPTENGSKVCEGRNPSKDAHLVKLFMDEGSIIFGKCVTEGKFCKSTTNSLNIVSFLITRTTVF